jgi:conserved oligomeric Golgi complex subunit 6
VAPPLAVLDHAQILREIMGVYASSAGDPPALLPIAEATRELHAFERVLDVMVDPAVQMCLEAVRPAPREVSAGRRPRKDAGWDREVFGLNCLTFLQVCACERVSVGGCVDWSAICRACLNRLSLRAGSGRRSRR